MEKTSQISEISQSNSPSKQSQFSSTVGQPSSQQFRFNIQDQQNSLGVIPVKNKFAGDFTKSLTQDSNNERCLFEKREQFAVSLRQTKKKALLDKRRQALGILNAPIQEFNDHFGAFTEQDTQLAIYLESIRLIPINATDSGSLKQVSSYMKSAQDLFEKLSQDKILGVLGQEFQKSDNILERAQYYQEQNLGNIGYNDNDVLLLSSGNVLIYITHAVETNSGRAIFEKSNLYEKQGKFLKKVLQKMTGKQGSEEKKFSDVCNQTLTVISNLLCLDTSKMQLFVRDLQVMNSLAQYIDQATQIGTSFLVEVTSLFHIMTLEIKRSNQYQLVEKKENLVTFMKSMMAYLTVDIQTETYSKMQLDFLNGIHIIASLQSHIDDEFGSKFLETEMNQVILAKILMDNIKKNEEGSENFVKAIDIISIFSSLEDSKLIKSLITDQGMMQYFRELLKKCGKDSFDTHCAAEIIFVFSNAYTQGYYLEEIKQPALIQDIMNMTFTSSIQVKLEVIILLKYMIVQADEDHTKTLIFQHQFFKHLYLLANNSNSFDIQDEFLTIIDGVFQRLNNCGQTEETVKAIEQNIVQYECGSILENYQISGNDEISQRAASIVETHFDYDPYEDEFENGQAKGQENDTKGFNQFII